MVVLVGEPSSVYGAKGALGHSFLENLIERRNAGDIARLHMRGGDIRAPFDLDVRVGGAFDRRTEEVRALAASLPHALSPARLLESDRLQEIPRELLAAIGNTLHAAYLDVSGIHGVVTELQCYVDIFADELSRFRLAWERVPASTADAIERSFKHLQQAAGRLREAIARVPDGIIIP